MTASASSREAEHRASRLDGRPQSLGRLKLSRHYMKQLPMLGIPHVRRIIPFFFPHHLDVKALQQLQHLLPGVVRPIGDRRPGISFPKELPSEPAAWTNRRDDPVPEPRKMLRLAKRQCKARVHQIAWEDFHLR